MKAFPAQGMTDRNGQKIEAVYETGMDLRDYFAAKAMEAMVLRAIDEEVMPDELAINSYVFADAMMKAREQ